MRRVAALSLLLPLVVATAGAAGSQPLLDVRVFSNDPMVDSSPQTYLYLRVFDDGRVEYEDRKTNETEFVLRQKVLAAEELRSLKDFLNNADVLHLPPAYSPAISTVDHQINVTLSIDRGEKLQTIQIPNYNLTSGKDKGLYSQPLINLMCRIERARGNTSLQLTSNGWCALWSRS
jgi:hypothetical protein